MVGLVMGPGPNGGYQWYPTGAVPGMATGAVPPVPTSSVPLAPVSRSPIPSLLMPPTPMAAPDRPAGTPRHLVRTLTAPGALSGLNALAGAPTPQDGAWPQTNMPPERSWWEQLLAALGVTMPADAAWLPTADGGFKRAPAQGGRKDNR